MVAAGRGLDAPRPPPLKFDVQEIDQDIFVRIALDEMILPTSPFNPLLDKLPSDLWSNAEAYLVQLEENGTLFA